MQEHPEKLLGLAISVEVADLGVPQGGLAIS